jgi:hypothetical protein
MEYTDEKKGSDRLMLVAIQPNSVAALIIAESMEDGAGIRRAHQDAMEWLRRRVEAGQQNMEYWCLLATYTCHLRMKLTVTVVQKRGQGSNDTKKSWCQACMGWVTQLLVRTRVDPIPPEWGGPLSEDKKKSPWFQKKNSLSFPLTRSLIWTRPTKI